MLFAASVLAIFGTLASAQVIGINDCADIPGWVPTLPLGTANEPVFSAGESGFSSLDTLSLVWYNPNKTNLESATAFESPAASNQPVCVGGASGSIVTLPSGSQHNGECYNKCTYTLPLASLTAGSAVFIDNSNPAETLVRGKIELNNTEDLGPIFRDQPQTIRTIISNFPFEITFPTSVSATLLDLEAFLPPGLAAALILQSVDVNVVNLAVDGTVLIRTQFQWPYKFDTSGFAINAQNGIPSTISLKTDCPDPGVVDDSPADDGTVGPCDQIWEIKLTPNPNQCQLDGDFTIANLNVVCQPAFGSQGANCPISGNDNSASIDFTLDSEDYCPRLIEEVQITAALAAYKDAAFNTPAENYVIGDRIFFQATVTSTLVSLSTVEAATITVNYQGSGSVVEFDAANPGAPTQLVNLNVDNTGATTAQFAFDLTQGPFQPPVDGDQDFDVTVNLAVTFIAVNPGAPLLLEERMVLLQASSSAERRARASGAISNAADPVDPTTGDPSDIGSAAALNLGLATAAAGVVALMA